VDGHEGEVEEKRPLLGVLLQDASGLLVEQTVITVMYRFNFSF
jgi:hypothetical protein